MVCALALLQLDKNDDKEKHVHTRQLHKQAQLRESLLTLQSQTN